MLRTAFFEVILTSDLPIGALQTIAPEPAGEGRGVVPIGSVVPPRRTAILQEQTTT